MTKPKNWDLLLPVEQEAWRVKKRETYRKWRNANLEKVREKARERHKSNTEKERERKIKYRKANRDKCRESERKAYYKTRQQTAADQFFIMAGAAEQLTKLKPKQ